MEVVGSVASIAQLIEIAVKVCGFCATVIGASEMIDELGRTSSMMLQLLYEVKRQVDTGTSSARSRPLGPEDLVKELQICMINLGERFEKLRPKSIMSKLRFASMEKDIRRTIEKALRMNGFLNSWLTLDIKQTTKDIDDGVKALNNHAEQEMLNGKINRIVEYFAPVSFSEKHSDVLQQRQDGTGQWFFDSPEFQDWMKSSGRTLWCSGAPGAGKTVMASMAIEYLREKVRGDAANALAFVYCDYRQRQGQKAWVLLGNLWAQLFRRRGPSATEVDQMFGEILAHRDFRPTRTQITNLIRDELTNGNLDRIYVVVDALDECDDENERSWFIDSLHSLQPLVNVLVTSRTTHLDDDGFSEVQAFRFTPTNEDMGIYINARIRESKKLAVNVRRKPGLEEDIRRIVIDRANGMFLLCRMHLDSLSKAMNPKDLKNELKRIPEGENVVKDTYDQAMERIRDQGDNIESFALQVIRWVCFARRPLKLAELLCALAIEPGEKELDEDAVGEEGDIATYCAGLVVVEGESKTVRFVHYTTQEYFNSLRDTPEFLHSHGDIALTCISFLGLENLSLLKDGHVAQIWPSLDEIPFLVYAALHFGYHLGQESIVMASEEFEFSADIMDILLEFLQCPGHVKRASTTILLHIGGRVSSFLLDPVIRQQLPKKTTAIGLAAFFNVICEDPGSRPFGVSMEWLTENTGGITDTNEPLFGNPLHWACFFNSVESIEVLLSSSKLNLDANEPIAHPVGWQPSIFSVAYGSFGTLRALLDYGIDIYEPARHEWRTTILQEAIVWAHAVKGSEKTALIDAIMQKDTTGDLLIKRDVYMSTALMEAVRTADFSVFECVMEYYEKTQWAPGRKDQAVLAYDREGRTAMHWAIADSSLTFKNPDKTSTSGPLRILEALLDGPHAMSLLPRRNIKGDTPFEAAIRRGHIQAVETILIKNDQHSFTNFYPSQLISGLYLAARVTESPMIDLLLRHVTSDLLLQNRPSADSVLHHAASGNKPENMDFLLQKLVDLRLYNVPGSGGNFPLHYAAASGNMDAVAALLKQKDISIDSQNENGQTALHFTTGSGLADVCSTLLEAGANINAKDGDGDTPLKLAIKKRSPEVLAIMLHYSSANLDNLDAEDVAWVQQQPWGHDILHTFNNTPKPGIAAETWPWHEQDIVTAALCLQRKFNEANSGTPTPSQRNQTSAYLVSRIFDLAQYWTRASSVRVSLSERGEVRRWGDPATPYMMSKAIPSTTAAAAATRPVRRVVFEITGHDQGYCSDPSRGESWTWFTADIHHRRAGGSSPAKELAGLQDQTAGGATTNREINIVYNRGADRRWFTHRLSWSLDDDGDGAAGSERGVWLRALAPGDRIVVVPHARYPGWENWVRRVRIDVFTTCLKSRRDYLGDR